MPGRPGRSGGRNRKTAERHLADGTFQPARHGKRPPVGDAAPAPAPRAVATVPTAPSFLRGHALQEWRRVVRLLGAKHLLELVDRAALTAYCLAWQELLEAAAAIAAHLAGWQELLKDPEAARSEALRRCTVVEPSAELLQAIAAGVHREAAEFVAAGGRLGRNRFGETVAYPGVRIAAAAEKRVREFCVEFGLTPLARNRVQAQKPRGTGNTHATAAEREAAKKRQARREIARDLGIRSVS